MRGYAVLLAGLLSASALADPARPAGKDWPAVGGDWANDHYSTLSQIDTRTVKQLGGAWVHQFDGERSRGTPVVTGGRMFVTAGTHVYANPVMTCQSGPLKPRWHTWAGFCSRLSASNASRCAGS